MSPHNVTVWTDMFGPPPPKHDYDKNTHPHMTAVLQDLHAKIDSNTFEYLIFTMFSSLWFRFLPCAVSEKGGLK